MLVRARLVLCQKSRRRRKTVEASHEFCNFHRLKIWGLGATRYYTLMTLSATMRFLREDNMQNSNIEWTNQTWNPVTGCTKVSPGCKNCYAANIADTRFAGQQAFPEGFALTIHPERLAQVTPHQQPKNIFVNSMSDMFHEGIPIAYLRRVCDVMMGAPQHRYQILTKRHQRMQKVLGSAEFQDAAQARHIWWGVSAEDRKYGLPRVETLLDTPVRNRFVSFEPLLEDLGEVMLTGIDWIIIGGESGPGARPFALEWGESLIRHARRDRVTAFMKQIGAKPTLGGEPFRKARRDPKGHQMTAWPEHLRVREFPRGMYGADGGPRLVQIAPIEAAPKSGVPIVDVPILALQQTTEWLRHHATEKSDPARSALALSALVAIEGLIPGSRKGGTA
jgi:protein gp37